MNAYISISCHRSWFSLGSGPQGSTCAFSMMETNVTNMNKQERFVCAHVDKVVHATNGGIKIVFSFLMFWYFCLQRYETMSL
jgi:hypothetical protein